MIFPTIKDPNGNCADDLGLPEPRSRFCHNMSIAEIQFEGEWDCNFNGVADSDEGVACCAEEDGDLNGDGVIDLSDVIYVSSSLFQGGHPPVPFCIPAGVNTRGRCNAVEGDVNGDNGVDLSTAIYLLTFLFQGGSPPLPICPP